MITLPAPALTRRLLRFARSEAGPLAAVGVLIACLWIFLSLVEEVVWEGETHAFDAAILAALRVPGHPDLPIGPWWLKEVARDLTALGSTAVLTLIALIATGFVVIQRQYAAAVLLLAALGGGTLLSEGLKHVFERDRPAEAWRLAEVTNSSFPSGHSMLSAVAYLTLGALLARVMRKRRLKAYVLTVGVVLTGIVGLTRIFLGAHWATDVFAGWSVGAAWATACWLASFAVERMMHRRLETPQPAPPTKA
jgi:undecaprenyl-diphosphatase